MKQPFHADGPYLTDNSEDTPYQIRADRVATRLAESLRRESPPAELPAEASRSVDELLAGGGLARGDLNTILWLGPHCDEPRVRAAFMDALATNPPGRLWAVARHVARRGGDGVRELLRARLDQLAARSSSLGPPGVRDLASIAHELLLLDPENTPAATALLRAFDHSSEARFGFVRAAIVSVCESVPIDTDAIGLLRDHISTVIAGGDDRAFCDVLRGARDHERLQSLDRLRSLFASEASELRASAARAALQLRAVEFLQVAPAVLEWLRSELRVRPVLLLLERLWDLLPEQDQRDIVRRGLAAPGPMERLESCCLLARLPSAAARELARDALADEPDAQLAKHLRLWAEPS